MKLNSLQMKKTTTLNWPVHVVTRLGLIALAVVMAFISSSSASSASSHTPPYSPSKVIQQFSFDFNTEVSRADGSDQWPMTWASNDSIYALWGDGKGWHNSGSKKFMGLTKIDGVPVSFTATDVWGIDTKNMKPLAIVADGTSNIYLFYDTEDDGWKGSHPGFSTDNGASWTFPSGAIFHLDTDNVKVVGIAQFGPGYSNLPSEVDAGYFYVYLSNRNDGRSNDGQNVFLGRVLKADIFDRSKYEYFAGLNNGSPIWSSNWNNRTPAFHDDEGMGYHANVTYDPNLGRFIYAKSHDTSHLGIFEGPNLWGPWGTVYYDEFKDDKWKFTYQFPQKWMNLTSDTEETAWMAYSGWPQHDRVYFIEVSLTVCPSVPHLGGQRSQDLNGSGICGDLNANNEADFADVVAMAEYRLTDNHPAQFDLDGDGQVTMVDVKELFFTMVPRELRGRSD